MISAEGLLTFTALLPLLAGQPLNVRIMNVEMQANIGDNVSLHCLFTPPENSSQIWLTTLILQWNRSDKPTSVYSIEKGKPNLEYQDLSYQNKTMLDKKQLLDGNATLVLMNVQVAQEGDYECFVRLSAKLSGAGYLKLSLVANYSNPSVSCSDVELEDMKAFVNLSCQASGGYPEGKLEWRFSNGTRVSEAVMNTFVYKDEITSLYKMTSAILVLKRLVPELICVVKNPRMETEFQQEVKCQEGSNSCNCSHVNDSDLLQHTFGGMRRTGTICAIVLLLVLLGLFILAKYCFR